MHGCTNDCVDGAGGMMLAMMVLLCSSACIAIAAIFD